MRKKFDCFWICPVGVINNIVPFSLLHLFELLLIQYRTVYRFRVLECPYLYTEKAAWWCCLTALWSCACVTVYGVSMSSHCVCVGFLLVVWFPPTSKKHTSGWTGYWMYECVYFAWCSAINWCPILGVLVLSAQCSWYRLWKNERVNECK